MKKCSKGISYLNKEYNIYENIDPMRFCSFVTFYTRYSWNKKNILE